MADVAWKVGWHVAATTAAMQRRSAPSIGPDRFGAHSAPLDRRRLSAPADLELSSDVSAQTIGCRAIRIASFQIN